MKTLSRSDLAPFRTRRITRVKWDNETEVCIQSLTEGELNSIYGPVSGGASAHAAAIQRAVVDEDGNRIFDDSKETLAFIESLDSAITRRLSKAIDEHLEFRREVADKAVEDSAKN